MSIAGEDETGPAPATTGCYADRVFRALALASIYILLRRWRAGGAGLSERPAPAEIAAGAALCVSVAWFYALPAWKHRQSGGISHSHRRWHQD